MQDLIDYTRAKEFGRSCYSISLPVLLLRYILYQRELVRVGLLDDFGMGVQGKIRVKWQNGRNTSTFHSSDRGGKIMILTVMSTMSSTTVILIQRSTDT